MDRSLRVLLLEDIAPDAAQIEDELARMAVAPTVLKVESEPAYAAALTDFRPDVILADYALQAFGGLDAMRMANAALPDVPFIFVAWPIGEEKAVAAVQSGAADYVLKDRLVRLHSAIQRALAAAEDRRRRHAAEEELRRTRDALEERIQQRTAELSKANNELLAYADRLHDANLQLQSQAAAMESQAEELQAQNDQLISLTDELERERALLEAVLQQMPAGLLIVEAPSGKLLMGNERAESLLDHPLRPGDGPEVYAPRAAYHPNGEPYPPGEFPLERTLGCGETITGEEVDLRGVSGSRTLSVSVAPVQDQEGRFIAAVSTFFDISERRLMERSLRQTLEELDLTRATLEQRVSERTAELQHNEALLRKVLETLPVGVWVTDAAGNIITGNPAGYQIWSGARLVPPGQYGEYRGWWAATGEAIKADEWALARAVAQGETSVREEIEIECFDGSRKVILNSATPIYGPDGELIAAIAVNEDITERKQTELALARNNERLAILHEIDRAVLAARSAPDIAREAVKRLRLLVPSERVAVVLFDYEREEAVRLAVDADNKTVLTSGTRADLAFYHGKEGQDDRLLVDDLSAVEHPSLLVTALVKEGLRSYLGVPLMVDGRLIGNLNLSARRPHALSQGSLDIVRQVADSLAVAIQNARLNQQVQTDRVRLQELSRRLVDIQETERRVIAQELHDEAGQALTSLIVGLGLLEREVDCTQPVIQRVWQLKQTTEDVMEGLHRLAVNLRPASLDRVGLAPTLRQYAEAWGVQNNLDVQVEILGIDEHRLPAPFEIALYRIVQEGLTNVARHAHAQHVGVLLEQRDQQVIAIIEDDGVGFDPGDAVERGRLGLFGMRERAEMLGGSLMIESARGAGTTVFVQLPMSPAEFSSDGGSGGDSNSDRR